MNKKWTKVFLFMCLPALLFFCILCNESRLDAQTQTSGTDNSPSSMQQPASGAPTNGSQQQPQNQEPRQDNYYGTFHEGIVMETDPQTGTRIIQVTPPPEKEKNSNSDNTYVISPEIKINSK